MRLKNIDPKIAEFLFTETFLWQIAKKNYGELMLSFTQILTNPELPEETKEHFQELVNFLQEVDLRPQEYGELILEWGKQLSSRKIYARPFSFYSELVFKLFDED